jgi:peroxiredoxin
MNRRLLAVLFAGLALSGPALAQPQTTVILRDSVGQRRAELDKIELTAFPADAWSKLTAWTNGEAITGADLDGKPALVLLFGAWHPSSVRALSTAQQMAQKYGEQGLVVVGVHHPQGWDKAAQVAKDRNLTFRLGHDSTGDFRKAIKADKEPDWYIIDRAGHLRYGAVSTASVDAACAEVVKESREQASDLPRILKERKEAEAIAQGRSTDIRQDLASLAKLPPVPPGYSKPSEGAYKDRAWPKMDKQFAREMGLMDQQSEKMLEPALSFEPHGYHPKAPVTDGRVILIYWWHPDYYMTYNPVMSQMDLLQRKYPRDLAVIGAMLPPDKIDRNANQGQQNQEEQLGKLHKKYTSFIASRTYEHALAADMAGTSINSISSQNSQAFPLPGAMLVSTDGIIRWVGWTNRSDFQYAIDSILAADPGIKARREADRKYIETSKK